MYKSLIPNDSQFTSQESEIKCASNLQNAQTCTTFILTLRTSNEIIWVESAELLQSLIVHGFAL